MALLFDVGGTNLRCAELDVHTGGLGRILRRPLDSFLSSPRGTRTLSDLADAFLDLANEYRSRSSDLIAVGFGAPLDHAGQVLDATALGAGIRNSADEPGFDQLLRRRFPSTKVIMMNDMMAAGYHFVQQGHSDFIIITISSGVGQKLFLGGHPVLGPQGWGGEIGHLVISDAVPPDSSHPRPGKQLEERSSARGIERAFRRQWQLSQPQDRLDFTGGVEAHGDAELQTIILGRLLEGSPLAIQILNDCLSPLSHALAAVMMGTGVTTLILTGGGCEGYGRFIKGALEGQLEILLAGSSFVAPPTVVLSENCQDDVLMGLVAHILRNRSADTEPGGGKRALDPPR